MISVESVKQNYYACDSCSKNRQEDDVEVLMIKISNNGTQSSSFKLCEPCFEELSLKAKRRS